MKKRDLLKAASALPMSLLISGGSAFASQQPYPSKTITLVVPFAPGNSADILARQIAQQLGESLHQQVVVENRPGSGGVGAINQVTNAKADGYTLLLIGTGAAISQSMFKPQPYDLLKSFVPVCSLTASDVLILVGKDSRLNTLDDFIREARARKRALMVGVSLLGTAQHLTAELFKLKAGVDFTIVPFRSAGAATLALGAGDLEVVFELLPAVLGPLNGGQVRALAITSDKRSPVTPNVPTADEQGVPEVNVTSWGMIVAPAHTPDAVVQQLNRGLQSALADPAVAKRFQDLGIRTLGGR